MLSLNLCSLQASGKFQDAERELRALLDLMRENEAAVQENLLLCQQVLVQASKNLTILDPLVGEKELIKSVAAEMTKVTAGIAENSQRQKGPGGA